MHRLRERPPEFIEDEKRMEKFQKESSDLSYYIAEEELRIILSYLINFILFVYFLFRFFFFL